MDSKKAAIANLFQQVAVKRKSEMDIEEEEMDEIHQQKESEVKISQAKKLKPGPVPLLVLPHIYYFKTHDNKSQRRQISAAIHNADRDKLGITSVAVTQWILRWSDDSADNHFMTLDGDGTAKFVDGL